MITNFVKVLMAGALVMLSMQARAGVDVSDAWVRGVVPGQTATGAFMTIRSSDAVTLIAATSPAAKSVDIHQMSVENGMMRMLPVDAIPIGRHGVLELKPGAYHVMLSELVRPVRKGDNVPITLTFRGADGQTFSVVVQARVRDLTATSGTSKGM